MSSAHRPLLLCDCRYSVPPEHGKRLERLAKGTVSPPRLSHTLLGAMLVALKCLWSESLVAVLRPAGGGLSQIAYLVVSVEQLKPVPFPTLSWEGN